MVNSHELSLKKKLIICLVFVILVLSLNGCSFSKKTVGLFTNNPKLANEINNSINIIYPDNFKIIHHTVLDLAGKNYVLNGYIIIDKKLGKFSINAQNDLGGTIFKIFYIEKSIPEILIEINAFKEWMLKKSVMKDLKYLYLSQPFPTPLLIIDDNKTYKLVQKNVNGIDEERVFIKLENENKYLLKSYSKIKSGNKIYKIQFKYKKIAAGNLPDTISIIDKKMHYKLSIKTQYFLQ